MAKQFHVHIDVRTDEEIRAELREVSEILIGLREKTKDWELHYGADRRYAKKAWEEKADTWISKWKVITNK